MPEPLIIRISDLTSTTVTRARGTEAFRALMEVIRHSASDISIVLVDISGAKVISGSFLDELILRISGVSNSSLPRIGFRIGSDAEVAKLERACSLRQVCCLYQNGHEPEMLMIRIKKEPTLQASNYPGNFFLD